MSVPVDLPTLEPLVEALGPEALLVSVTPEATPHIVSVLVSWRESGLHLLVGKRTCANVSVHRNVTVIWPRIHDGVYRLIVDGAARMDDDSLTVVPTFAVLHRIAGAGDAEPTCRAVGIDETS